MSLFRSRLFFRIMAKSRQIYALKIVTLAVAFATSTLIIIFSINEFGYDRFHDDYRSVYRVLQKNNRESYDRNRLSNKIPPSVIARLRSTESLVIARVKLMKGINVIAGDRLFRDVSMYAADSAISQIFSFALLDGSLEGFHSNERCIMLSSAAAIKYFGAVECAGRNLKIFTFGDTLTFSVAAVYRDFPPNSHEQFFSFMTFDSAAIRMLSFDPADAGLYARSKGADVARIEADLNDASAPDELTYRFQPLAEIYFGPRVLGDDATHGDRYSIVILICLSALILFLALSVFINLTTLTLPARAKEFAVKKLAGTSQGDLIIAFAKESFFLVGMSLAAAIFLLALAAPWIRRILGMDLVLLATNSWLLFVLIWVGLSVVAAVAPLFVALPFTRAAPVRLLSTETITFPQFKRTIMCVQLGISIFLIVSAMVVKRQINYSLLKEPGRNYDQVVYVRFPSDMTDASIDRLRKAWKEINPNFVDLMATSQLPGQIRSKEINSDFYFMSVDRGFMAFFQFPMVEGNWFKPNEGDSVVVVNEAGKRILTDNTNVIGVFSDMSGLFNLPQVPLKVNTASHLRYNFLCIRILEVDIRRTVQFLSNYFATGGVKADVSFLDKHFEDWLRYQDKLNRLSEVLAIISGLLSCFAVYGLSISVVRDKLQQIAVHKLFGASSVNISRLLMREFTRALVKAILIFGPLTYLFLKEMLRTFVYSTHFIWLDPFVPLAYCCAIIALLCVFQSLNLNRHELSAALKS